VYNSSVKELIMNRIKNLVFTLSSRVRYISTVAGIILCCVLGTLGFAACTSPAGGDSVPTYPHTLTADNVVIKITETDTPPLAKAATTPVAGNYYWVFLPKDNIDQGTVIDDNVVTVTFNSGGNEFVLIDQGTVSIDDTASISFYSNSGGEFILKPSGDGYTLDGKIHNSLTGELLAIGTLFTDSDKGGKTDPIGVYPVVSTLDGVVTGYKSLDAAISGAGTGSRITLYANQTIANGTGLANKTLTLTGYGENRNITHAAGAAMFTLAGSDRLILDANITLDGEGAGSGEASVNDNQKQPLVSVTGAGATLEMMGNATITGLRNGQNDTSQNVPGAVSIQGGIFVMSGNSRITNSRANAGKGGGVQINGGSLTMKDDAVIGGTDGAAAENVATCGGGVYVGTGGSLTMNDRATITGNRATGGGGVYIEGGVITMNDDAKIINNSITGRGGGVYIKSGTFTMNGRAGISGNWANSDLYSGGHGPGDGGGVYIEGGTFTMAGGTITGNSAQYTHNSNGPIGKGGGVYITGGTFAIPVGDLSTYVSGNSADNSAGDQIYKNSGTFKIGEASQGGGPWN
jgi:hypothetical protein